MTKEHSDRTTPDLFADERRPGRPKTSPLPRNEQLRISKRNQLKRDKMRGLHRIELKISSDILDMLIQLTRQRNASRSKVIEALIVAQFSHKKS